MQSGEIDFQRVFSFLAVKKFLSFSNFLHLTSSHEQRNDLHQANKSQFGLIRPFNLAK